MVDRPCHQTAPDATTDTVRTPCPGCRTLLTLIPADGGWGGQCPACAGRVLIPFPAGSGDSLPVSLTLPKCGVRLQTHMSEKTSNTFWTVLAGGLCAVFTLIAVIFFGGKSRSA